MYNNPTPYAYYGTVNTPLNYSDRMLRSHQEIDVILSAINKEASALELYRQLANVAPIHHQNDILHALESKKAHLGQLNNLYSNLTGTQPMYQIDPIEFYSYGDGLQKAYQVELENYEAYHRNSQLTQNPYVRNVFLWALANETDNLACFRYLNEEFLNRVTDYGPNPFVVDINKATKNNNTFRTVLWTGEHLQLTLMSIKVGEEIGLENHPNLDQFLRVEEGEGLVQMGDRKDRLDFQRKVSDDFAILIPAGKWHNLINTGKKPLKLYSIYAPPQHPFGTVHKTKADAMAAEEGHQRFWF